MTKDSNPGVGNAVAVPGGAEGYGPGMVTAMLGGCLEGVLAQGAEHGRASRAHELRPLAGVEELLVESGPGDLVVGHWLDEHHGQDKGPPAPFH